jgi:FG-GAP-like repeat
MTRLSVSISFALSTVLAAQARAQVCFEANTPLDAHSGAQAVLSVDMDLDGKPDVVSAGSVMYSGCLRIYRGQGSGTFSTPAEYRIGPEPRLIRSADLDGDGYPDLVVPGSSWGYLSVFLNRGDGSLGARVDYDLGLGDADCVACADFDGDGDIDIACGNTDWSWLKLLLNNGDGTFATPTPALSHLGFMDLVAEDFDGDGDPDLAALCWPGVVEVFVNLGAGTFAAPVSYNAPMTETYHLASADFDGDGAPDLAVVGSTYPNSVIDVLRNLGGGLFGTATSYAFGPDQEVRTLTIADLDGDAHPELIATGGGTLFVLGNHGDGTFTVLEPQATVGGARASAVADFDGDARSDLFVAGSAQLWLMHNESGWRFYEPPRIPIEKPLVQALAADLDGDGIPDLAAVERTQWGDPLGRVRILRNDGSGVFDASATCLVGRCPAALAAADLDGDGALDLVVANDGYSFPGPTGSLSVLLNHGDGTFAPELRTTLGTFPRAIASADVDLDGRPDVLVLELGPAPNYQGTVAVLLNDGHAGLRAPVRYQVGVFSSELQVVDLDGDGALEVVALNLGQGPHANDVSILRNQGNGTFAPAVTVAAGLHPGSLACGDVDGDGDVDLVLRGSLGLEVLLNSGAGAFSPPRSHRLALGANSIALEDVDGDGALDALVSNSFVNTIAVLQNAGGGWFHEAGEFGAGPYPGRACGGDFDADGDLDIACTGVGGITLLRNCAEHAQGFCSGDGSAGACPCNNSGASGHGCENSAATGGAILSASGSAGLGSDTLVLRSEGELASSVSVVLQGTLRVAPVGFGDGLRCVGGSLKRLYVRNAVGGVLTAPQPGEPSISARSAALGDTIHARSTRCYQVYYRDGDPAFCAAPQGSSWNVSSGLAVRWLQ